MSTNPFSQSCALAGCGQPVAARGRCAVHAAQHDAQRSLNSDRHHAQLYASARWRRLRRQMLTRFPFCQCDDCREQMFDSISTVVHHKRAHHGIRALFFDETNLQALSKVCHDRITGRNSRK